MGEGQSTYTKCNFFPTEIPKNYRTKFNHVLQNLAYCLFQPSPLSDTVVRTRGKV